jgi:uncharacterized protein (DUF1800 family)
VRFRPSHVVLTALCMSLVSLAPELTARNEKQDPGANQEKRAVHALNRLTFGPRPGDVQHVMAIGVENWIDLQLHPERIEDSHIESRLAPLRSVRMSSKEIAEAFPSEQVVRQVLEGKRPMPSDAAQRAVYRAQAARLRDKQELKAGAAPANLAPNTRANDLNTPMAKGNGANSISENAAQASLADDGETRRREQRLCADLSIQQLVDLPPDARYKKILAMSADEQLALADSFRGGKGQEFLDGLDPRQKETLLAMNNPQGVMQDELTEAKLLRAIYSERQLEEVMTDFWFNHFNVFIGKGADRLLLTSYERDVIRPRALGKFEDLLVATAKSPAMLFYLDNWMSVGPGSAQALGTPVRPFARRGPWGRPVPPRNPRPTRKQNVGLNENYGRELLELHTLSVNGGYSQRDVTEVAKVFTGWTIEKPFEGGGFRYDARMHEPGPKFVLGHRIKPKGEAEGLEVLHRLATSPQTAHFISLKLAQRFVSDDPPPLLVDRMAKTFLKKKGDIREVLSALFHSPEFWADDTYRAKLKTPLEFVASAVCATGADVEDASFLSRQLNSMGMPLYGAQAPTGYSMKAEVWVSSSALLNRLNFALALTGGRIRGVKVNATQLVGGSGNPIESTAGLAAMENSLLAGDVSKQTHNSILTQLVDASKGAAAEKNSGTTQHVPAIGPSAEMGTIAGLLLGSPEFQRR